MNPSVTIQSLGQLIARVLIGLLFIVAGIFKMHGQSFYFPYISSIGGTAQPEITLPLGYAMEIGAAIALIAGWKTHWAAWILIFYTIILTVLFQGIAGPDDAQYFNKLSHVVKNLGVTAGLLFMAVHGGGSISVDAVLARTRDK